jgi:pantothenate kinase type III
MKDFLTYFCEETSSTLDLAKNIVKKNTLNQHVITVVAGRQVQGRGRAGRVWLQSEVPRQEKRIFQKNVPLQFFEHLEDVFDREKDFLPLTFIIPPERLLIPQQWLTALVGCAVYDALVATELLIKSMALPLAFQNEKNMFLKWPNDLMVRQKFGTYQKICGILCEASVIQNQMNALFVGIGLNFFHAPPLQSASSFWENLFFEKLVTKEMRFKNELLNHPDHKKFILKEFSKFLIREICEFLFQKRNVSELKKIVLHRSLPLGTPLLVEKKSLQGSFLGLTDDAALLLAGHHQPLYSEDLLIQKEETPAKYCVVKPLTLAIDFGNTSVHFAFEDSKKNLHQINVPYERIFSENQDEMKHDFKVIINILNECDHKKIHLVYVSVNSYQKTLKAIFLIKKYLKFLFPEVSFLNNKVTEKDVFNAFQIGGHFDSSHFGADRALKLYFAYKMAKKNKKNTLTFCVGTATTCEGVSAVGTLLENFIFPGLQMSFHALHDHTALVPLFQANEHCVFPYGQLWNQEVYVQRGVFLSVASTLMTTLHFHSPCQCFLTGGGAAAILNIVKTLVPENNFEIHVVSNIETHVLLNDKDSFLKEKKSDKNQKK